MKLEEVLQSSVSSENLAGHLEWFSQVRRDTGGAGEDAAASYIVETLEKSGVPVRVHEFDAYLSYPRQASLTVEATESFSLECVTHSFARSTGPEGLRGPIVDGSADELEAHRGEIVLVDGLCTPATVLAGSKAGVAALVFANQDRVIHNMIATTIWGTPTPEQLHRLPTIPVVSVNRESGERLKALIGQGACEVRIQTEVETGWFRSKLPEVRIEGARDPDTFTLVGAHYCAWEVGVTDNATGDAVLLEMARILHENRERLDRSVRICWWPGHSHGRYSGSTWYADTFFRDLGEHCVTYHNIDSPGVRGATKYVARHTTAEVEDFCKLSIDDLTGQNDPPVHRPSRAADQAFLANGVPAFSCYPFLPDDHPDRRPWTGGCANALWWHSSEDTLDKADIDILTLDTKISTTAIGRLATMDLLPIRPERGAADLAEFARHASQTFGGDLGTEELEQVADRFAAATQRFADLRDGLTERDRTRYDKAAMRLSRTTVSLTYSKGGRFTHDPAEWSPIMRNTRSSVFPGLNAIDALDEIKDTELEGFVKTGIRRQVNRAVTELEVATETCNSLVRQFESSPVST